jgi:hypothetical protein
MRKDLGSCGPAYIDDSQDSGYTLFIPGKTGQKCRVGGELCRAPLHALDIFAARPSAANIDI